MSSLGDEILALVRVGSVTGTESELAGILERRLRGGPAGAGHDIRRIGAKAGNIFFSNTAGCVLGTLLTGFLLIHFAGIWNTTLILVNLSLLITLAMLLRRRESSAARWASLLLA